MKKTKKMLVSLVLVLTMISALCLPSYALMHYNMTEQVRYSFSGGWNIQHTAITHARNDLMGNINGIWGSMDISRYDDGGFINYVWVDAYAYVQAYAHDGQVIDEVSASTWQAHFPTHSNCETDILELWESDDFMYMFAIYESVNWVDDNPDNCETIFRYTPTYYENDLFTDSYIDDF